MSKDSQKDMLPQLKFRLGRRARIAALLLIFAGVMSLVLAANKWNSEQNITKINITGSELIPHAEIMSLIADPVLNRPKNNIRLEEIETLTRKHPYVLASSAVMQSPEVLKIELRERKPVAVVVAADGELFYSDKSGTLLPYRLFANVNNLPVISGCFPGGDIDTAAIASALKIAENLKNDSSELLDFFVSEINYEPLRRSFSLISCERGLKVLLGKIDDVDNKMKRLSLFCGKCLSKESVAKLNYIDLRWEKQIVTG